MCADFATECAGIDEVDEGSLSVDLHHRQPLPVRGLELGIPADVDFLEDEAELLPERAHLLQRPLAEVAALRVIQRDPPYG